MKTEQLLVTPDVRDVCSQIAGGLITVTEAVLMLIEYDVMVVSIDTNSIVVTCMSDSIKWTNNYDAVTHFDCRGPEHFVVKVSH